MRLATLWLAAAAALCAAPLCAQDTTQTKPDTAAKADSVPKADTVAGPAVPAPAPAPAAAGVRPGMTEAQVKEAWGDPVAVRRVNDWTYLFFRNGRERQVGYYDVVFLQSGQVVDAIVRGDGHEYLGQSSSPPGRTPVFTPPASAAPADSTKGGAVTGVQVKPGP